MTEVLAVTWWVAAFGGHIAVVMAAVVRGGRRTSLIVAAALWGVAGVLGILSIGIIFLLGALVCVVMALRMRAGSDPPVHA